MQLEFFHQLKPITQFDQVTDPQNYKEAPDNWVVILSDIQGSTKAIEAGKYKEVNLIGAATISAIQNVLGTKEFPFVFGGDGATVLLPENLMPEVLPALQNLQQHALENFDLRLRVGVVPIRQVHQQGGQILLAKYQVSPKNHLAMFLGGGLQLAERLLKSETDGAAYLLKPMAQKGRPRLKNLSCRWAPVKNRNGTIMTVIVQSLDPARSNFIYKQILQEVAPIFDSEESRPVSISSMRLEKFGDNLKRELALRTDLGFWGRCLQIFTPMIASRLAIWFPFLPGTGRFREYLVDSMVNSDYKKVDDVLRMVLDCRIDQAEKLESLLKKHFEAKEIFYGIHLSQEAIMTCIMMGLKKDEHIHFIDGGNGGYTMAAKGMKAQKAS